MKRNSIVIAAHLIAFILMLLLIQGCQSVDSTASTKEPSSSTTRAATATSETAITTSEDPTNYEPSETGNTTVSESAHESTEPNTEETTEAGTTEPKPTEPKPTEPKPTEPKPTEPKPTEPKPTEPKPTEPKPTNPSHNHVWYVSKFIKFPNCTDAGEGIRTCDICGYSEQVVLPAEPDKHEFGVWMQTKAPTCGSDGTESRTCSKCGNTETRTVAATGNHTWEETAPTCTAAGAKSCTVCGRSETIAALGHDWVHHDEEGEYRPVITCYCGMRFIGKPGDDSEAGAAWDAHSDENWENGTCGGFEEHEEWFVTKAAYDSCSRCHATR